MDVYIHLDSKIKELQDNNEKEYNEVQSHIHTIKGIGTNTVACIYSEYGGITSFHKPNQMLAYAGLEPSKTSQHKKIIMDTWSNMVRLIFAL